MEASRQRVDCEERDRHGYCDCEYSAQDDLSDAPPERWLVEEKGQYP
jgi:hypothetical protein